MRLVLILNVTLNVTLEEGQKSFLVKDQIVNIFGFVDHIVSATIAQFCHRNIKTAKTVCK